MNWQPLYHCETEHGSSWEAVDGVYRIVVFMRKHRWYARIFNTSGQYIVWETPEAEANVSENAALMLAEIKYGSLFRSAEKNRLEVVR